MGMLIYGDGERPVQIEDRALAHLKAVIVVKLRRNESFTVSWRHPDDAGRSTLWLHPSIPLHFMFEGSEPEQLNRIWLEKLMDSANTSGGILLVDEVVEEA